MQSKILSKSGFWILRTLSVLPILFWLAQGSIGLRFANWPAVARSLGQLAGLCGMAMFSLTIILSARLKIFEKVFNGINEVYPAHHNLGALSFCLLLFHPLLLSFSYLMVSFQSAALFLLPNLSPIFFARNLGSIALFIMTVALLITFYLRIRYNFWKFSHKFLGLAFIFAFFHTLLIGSDIAINPALRAYIFVLGVMAILAYCYRVLFPGVLVEKFSYIVENITTEVDSIYEIEMSPKGKALDFLPGQFGFFQFRNKFLAREAHPFSFSSGYGKNLKVAIKKLGDYTNNIGKLKTGDLAEIEGPYGKFNFLNFDKNQIWIAGGVGVAPFLGMLRVLNKTASEFKIDLYYSAKDGNSLAFKKEIEEIASENKNLSVVFWETDKMGFINAKSIKDIDNKDILICGPNVMMQALKKQFLEQGIARVKIHTEEFQLY